MKLRIALVGLVCGLAWGQSRPAPTLAQDEPVAEITAPAEGGGLSGVVQIRGSALSQPFTRYEVAFAYDPNPRSTWFSIGEPGLTPVRDGVLTRWDTTGIADGVYVLRLRVYSDEQRFSEAYVGRVVVRQDLPTATPFATPTVDARAPASTATPAGTPAPAGPTVTPIPLPPPDALASDGVALGPGEEGDGRLSLTLSQIGASFEQGARWALAAFVLLGGYVGLKALLRRRR
jgi:hypothetical protein